MKGNSMEQVMARLSAIDKRQLAGETSRASIEQRLTSIEARLGERCAERAVRINKLEDNLNILGNKVRRNEMLLARWGGAIVVFSAVGTAVATIFLKMVGGG